MRKSDGWSCPYCGGGSGYVVTRHVSGFELQFVDWNGRIDTTENEDVVYRAGKTVRCLDCGKRVVRPDTAA